MRKLILKAGIPSLVTDSGRYFRILNASAEVDIRFNSNVPSAEWDLSTPLLSGIGLNFMGRPSAFTSFTVTSEVDQTIEYFAGLDLADDDRLAASATVVVSTAGKTASVPALKTLNDTVAGTEVLPALASRRTATYSIDGNCYLFDSVNGVELSAGLYSWDNQAALTLIPKAAGVVFKCLEEGE